MTRDELETKATELDINFNSQWKDETLIAKIEEAELAKLEEETKPDSTELPDESEDIAELELYTTTHNGKFVVGGVELVQGKSVELTAEVLDLKSTQRAIKLGLVVKA